MDSSDDEGSPKFPACMPDEASEELVAARAACRFTEEEVAAAVKVLSAMADKDDMTDEELESLAIRDVRQAMAAAHKRMAKKFFNGSAPEVFAARKFIRTKMRAEEQRQKMWDRRFVDSTGLRRSRIAKMEALEDQHGADAPMLLDGVAEDRGGDDGEHEHAVPAVGALEAAPAAGAASASSSALTVAAGAGPAAVVGAHDTGGAVGDHQKLLGQETGTIQSLERMAEAMERAEQESAEGAAAAEAAGAGAVTVMKAMMDAAGAAKDGDAAAAGSGAVLHAARSCYRCHARFVRLHHFYASMCPACAEVCWAKRRQTADLRGRIAVLTGGRVKIGFHVGMRLLRCGANVIVITRFPTDSARRYAAEKAAPSYAGRLHVYGVDLRSTDLLELWCAWVHRRYSHIDVLVNNACQTIRRPPAYFAHLIEAELRAHQASGGAVPADQRRMLRPYFDFLRWAQLAAESDIAAADAAWDRVKERRERRRAEAAEAGAGAAAVVGGSAVNPALLGFAEEDEGLEPGEGWAEGDGWGPMPEFSGGGKSSLVAALPAPEAAAAAAVAAAVADDADKAAEADGGDAPAAAGPAAAAIAGSSAAVAAGARPTIAPAPLLSQVAMTPEDEVTDLSLFPRGVTDTNEQQLDLRRTNSWMLRMHQISSAEATEVFTINAVAPFVLSGKLRGLMLRPPPEGNPTFGTGCASVKGALGGSGKVWTRDVSEDDASALTAERARRAAGKAGGEPDYTWWEVRPDRFVVQVSAMEGKFGRRKQPTHPHTNAAKAALNMMVKTSAQDYAQDRIFMTAVDTGWINPEQPVELAKTIAKNNHFQTPIDEVDAAARILDPVLAAVEARRLGRAKGPGNGPLWGVFLKDFDVSEW